MATFATVTAFAMASTLLVAQPAAAAAPDPAVSDVRVGLIELGSALAGAAEQPALSDNLPLTDTSVRDLLSLDTAIGTRVNAALLDHPSVTLDTLHSAFTTNELSVADATSPAGAPANSRDWIMTVKLASARPVALSYQDAQLQFGTAALDGEVAATLEAKIRFRYDPSAVELRRFAVVESPELPTLTTHVWTRAVNAGDTATQVDIQPFTAIDGFVRLDAEGAAKIDSTTVLEMRDPNGRGQITTEDLKFSSASDLFATEGPGDDDVAMSIDLSTTMAASATGTLTVGKRPAAETAPYSKPITVRNEALADISALTKLQAIVGFTEYSSALEALEASVDQQLPLLDLSLGGVYSPSAQILGLLTEQAAATIACGAANTNPPTGAPRPGQVRYCQAIAGSDAAPGEAIVWSAPDDDTVTITAPEGVAGTVGRTPTNNVVVSGGDGFPALRVTFTGTDGSDYAARSAVSSIQSLGEAIHGLKLGGEVTYDNAAGAFEIKVRQDLPDAGPTTVNTGGNGNLAPLTGLTGLCQAADSGPNEPRHCTQTGEAAPGADPLQTGDAKVTVSGRSFSADFGIGLEKPAPAPTDGEAAPVDPTVFLRPGTSGLVYEIKKVEAKLASEAQLVARIGFLQVDVDVTKYSLDQSGDTAASVKVPTSTLTLPSGNSTTGVVSVSRLLAEEAAVAPIVKRGLSAQATLKVSDSAQEGGTRPLQKSGQVEAEWARLVPDSLPTVTTTGTAADPGAYDALRLLDVVPARQSVMGTGTSGNKLVDPTADFITQFGFTGATGEDRVVTRPFYDLGIPSAPSTICSQFSVDSIHELTCLEGPLALAGATNTGMAPGHSYVMDGDPDALRDILIEDLAAVHSSFVSPDADLGADRTFPLVDLLPTEISVARDTLGNAIFGIQKKALAEDDDVSSMQEFSTTLKSLMKKVILPDTLVSAPELKFILTTGATPTLVLESSLAAKGDRKPPLRVATGTQELRVLGALTDDEQKIVALPVKFDSSAKYVVGVNLVDATSQVRGDTSVSEKITGLDGADADVAKNFETRDAELGSAQVKTGDAAEIKLGIGVQSTISLPGADANWTPISAVKTSLTQERTRPGAPQTCGDPTPQQAPEVAACIELPLKATDGTVMETVKVALPADQSSGGTGGATATLPIAYRFLTDGLSGLALTLADALEGDLVLDANGAPTSLPLVGTNLDAGADVPADVNRFVSQARAALTDVESIGETAPISELNTALAAAFTSANSQVSGFTVAAGPMQIFCADDELCESSMTVADVQKVTVALTLEKAVPTTSVEVPFHVGPAGSTIISNLNVPAKTGWKLGVTVGIERGSGPFVTLAPVDPVKPMLSVTVHAELPKYNADSCHSWTRASGWAPTGDETLVNPGVNADVNSARCIDAFVGKFPSVLVDRQKAGEAVATPLTKLDATIGVDVLPADPAGSLAYLPDLFDKSVEPATHVGGEGQISVYFEAFASKAKFFDVLGAIDQTWSDGVYGDLSFGVLRVDVTTFNSALIPGFEKAKKWLAPLNPVVDTLARPIPVVSELSEMVGQGPTSLMTLLSSAKNPKIQLILNLLQLQNLVAGGGDNNEPDLRPIGTGFLGGFALSPIQIDKQKCTETLAAKDGTTSTRKFDGSGSSGECEPDERKARKEKAAADEKLPKGTKVDKASTKSAYLSLPSVSVPVLQDTQQIFSMLSNTGDATLIYVDLGHAGVSAEISKKFGPFAVGPVPVTAKISGKAELDGRFAFGFDTRGLTKKINGLEPGDIEAFDDVVDGVSDPALLSNGFYISDLEDGVDVPEISLTFTVTAGAGVSIGFASAGIQGGVVLDLSLDAFDPNGDGKIYTDEFAGSATGPSCAFNVSSGISFFLQFYFELELFFYSYSTSFDIVRSPRLTLFEFNCAKQPDPVLAVVNAAKTEIKLTMGESGKSDRLAFPGQTAEKYTVRQLAPANSVGDITLQVSAFDVVQNYVVPKGIVITADAGENADTVRMYAMPVLTTKGANEPVMLSPGDDGFVAPEFNPRATIWGGTGNDTIETSDRNDYVDGGDGNDKVSTGAGDDELKGGDGVDQLDGGQGQDKLEGGEGDDRISGGPGADEVRGDNGDDTLDGGIGADPGMLFPTDRPDVVRPLLDAGDLVIGGNGSDNVTGGDGSDVVVGGNYAASGVFTSQATVKVSGVDALNTIQTFNVSGITTLTLPSDEAVKLECDSGGASGDIGADVVSGGGDRDFVIGGAGSDTLSGGAGDDVVCGRNGNDLLDGDGSNVVAKVQGNDLIRGGAGHDRINGSGGKDVLYGEAGDDLVRGGEGDDTIAGGAGSDLLLGEKGINIVVGDNFAADGPVAATGSAADADADANARDITCAVSTSVVNGLVDLRGDLSGESNAGQLEGLKVADGIVKDGTGNFTGIVGGVVFMDGKVDLDGNGKIERGTSTVLGDSGSIPLSGMTGAVGNGDCILGGDEADANLDGGAGADYIDAGAGDDVNVHGDAGRDLVRGGAGDDLINGDAGDDLVVGDNGNDILFGNDGADVLRGGSGDDLLAGGSEIAGAADGADEVLGDGGNDVVLGDNARLSHAAMTGTAIAGASVTLLASAPAQHPDDIVYGGMGDDWVFGQTGDDRTYGGPGKDVVEGGPGSDHVQGDDGDDLVIGGSSTTGAVTLTRTAVGVDDGNDVVVGDEGVDKKDGSDVLVGDNARLQIVIPNTRTVWQRIRIDVAIELFDVPTTTRPASASGDDTMRGGGFEDLIFGQGDNDTIAGESGADGIEGGDGEDVIDGGTDNDEIVGGSGTAATTDDGDTLTGGGGDDLLLGDNGIPTNGLLGIFVKLLDAPAPGASASAAFSGDDVVSGGTGEDRIFGQGGDDTLSGNDGVDTLEGGAGADDLSGWADDDVLTGGSSSRDGVISPARSGAGQLDGADSLSGGSGDDVLAGDNARLETTNERRTDGTRLRTVLLFDLATSKKAAPARTGGSDVLFGDEGRDLLFGQAGDDELAGGTDADYLEGNNGADKLFGNEGEDDLVGGGSSASGAIITSSASGIVDRLLTAPKTATDISSAGLLDGNDALEGGDARDVLLGDNGRITRHGPNLTLDGGASGTHTVRQVAMADKVPGVWSGSDKLMGGTGDDDLYGQFDTTRTKRPMQVYERATVPGDILQGGEGDDALIGDQALNVPTPAAALGAVDRTIKDSKSFVQASVRPSGTLIPVVTQTQAAVGGDDLILGDDGADSIHAGAGKDVVNAGAGNDVVFGGNDADALWGGADHDRIFGGAGSDLLDIKRRTSDSKLWQVAAPIEDTDRLRQTLNGGDILYGGSGTDALQADQGDTGGAVRVQGDRLIDWRSKINFFKSCESGGGVGKISNTQSASMTSMLRQLAAASGAVGSAELAIPGTERLTKYPNTGTFICETR
ncbi:calcium-binding protein [Glaciihabitans arcticus]|uniref:Calcium-binding protein n=1 Tax=Glaciihabitans arcticus TaxID=2668039 RepID=A0A4Q9GXH5_9MICO|nr:calcium-binding protein [Glaciihabitans arcticus]TBN58308.1 calcium-binding protein [Glaciihabitans arcticus]